MRIPRSSTFVFTLLTLFVAPRALAQGEQPPADDDPTGQAAPPGAPAPEYKPGAAAPAQPSAAPAAQQPTPEAAPAAAATGPQAPVTASAKPSAEPEPEPGAPGGPTTHGGPPVGEGGWRMGFHGYFRAPLRVGIGKRDDPPAGQGSTSFHAPVVPDDQYLSWQHTPHNPKDWAELFFSYGNDVVTGTVGIEAYNFTQAAWNNEAAQFGISQGYIEIAPDLGYENVRLKLKAGAISDRYGTAGKYDAGAYDTYLFGRTHVMGETLRAEIDLDKLTLGAEHGIGAKRPNPSVFNRAKFTLLHHAHVDATYDDMATFGLHYLSAFAKEEDRVGTAAAYANLPDGSLNVIGIDTRLDLNIGGYFYAGFSHVSANDALTVAPAISVLHSQGGAEFTLGVADNYLDSMTEMDGANGVDGSFSCAAQQYDAQGNPIALPPQPNGQPVNTCSGGNGSINALLAQYEFSFANLMKNLESPGERFWGEGVDLYLTLYGMLVFVSSEDKLLDNDNDEDGDITKLKYGADLEYSALPWLAFALRADRVQPNSEIPEQSFAILSPRVTFRSTWVTHEALSLQFSRYFYNERTCAGFDASNVPLTPADDTWHAGEQFCAQPARAPVIPDGFGAGVLNQDADTRGAATTRPDVNVVSLTASMWW